MQVHDDIEPSRRALLHAMRVVPFASAFLLSLALPACVMDGGGRPVLSVELLWDRGVTPARPVAGSCLTAQVEWMDWILLDELGEPVRESDPDGEPCADVIHFTEMPPGSYTLVINGYDAADQLSWSVSCTDLDIERFDERYACSIGYAP